MDTLGTRWSNFTTSLDEVHQFIDAPNPHAGRAFVVDAITDGLSGAVSNVLETISSGGKEASQQLTEKLRKEPLKGPVEVSVTQGSHTHTFEISDDGQNGEAVIKIARYLNGVLQVEKFVKGSLADLKKQDLDETYRKARSGDEAALQ